MKKYELTTESVMVGTRRVFRVKALISFGDVEVGELGGYVEREGNLSQSGNAWVYGDARVYGDAQVCGNAQVRGNAQVYGNARVYGDAWVCGDADYATIKGFGSECRNTTFFRRSNGGVGVACGCFDGTLGEFRDKVVETHKGSKFAKEYLMIADLMELHFGLGAEDKGKGQGTE